MNEGKSSRKSAFIILGVVLGLILVLAIVGVVLIYSAYSKYKADNMEDTVELGEIDLKGDIDVDSLKEAAKSIDVDIPDTDLPEKPDDIAETSAAGEVRNYNYSYTDVVMKGDDITVTPNRGLNGTTELYNGKDLNGFLDYIDSEVLEKGRTINRGLFYEILAIMLVDENLSPDFKENESDIIMALAVANNFHDTDVQIVSCDLNAQNSAEYRYNVKAFGTDDTWIVNYGKRTFYMNNGATLYSSDMFKNENLAVWLTATELYFEVQ